MCSVLKVQLQIIRQDGQIDWFDSKESWKKFKLVQNSHLCLRYTSFMRKKAF